MVWFGLLVSLAAMEWDGSGWWLAYRYRRLRSLSAQVSSPSIGDKTVNRVTTPVGNWSTASVKPHYYIFQSFYVSMTSLSLEFICYVFVNTWSMFFYYDRKSIKVLNKSFKKISMFLCFSAIYGWPDHYHQKSWLGFQA